MAKAVHNDVLDGMLNIVKNNANVMTVCSQQPTTRTEAITTYMLASQAMTSGDFTVADGATSGRRVTVAAKTGVTITNTGTGNHVALCDGTRLLYVTTCTPQSLASGNSIDFPTWDIEVRDPS